MCYVSQNVTCLWKFRMQFKFCLPGDTHQIRFHWHGSISLPFLCRMPAFGALRVADQNSFKVRARKQFEVVLEMTSVLWLISVVSGSSYSFQIATEGGSELPVKDRGPGTEAVGSADAGVGQVGAHVSNPVSCCLPPFLTKPCKLI